jgi:hypothetical protein
VRPEELVVEMLLVGDLDVAGLDGTDAIGLEGPLDRAFLHVVDVVTQARGDA